MNRDPHTTDDSWESDAVWKLLDQAPAPKASARFVDDTLRAVRLAADVKPWWKRLFSPVPLAGLAGATAALAFSFIMTAPKSTDGTVYLDSPQAVAIQDIAETETLIAAADRLDDFSDNELVSLIGF
ncbi:MAG: hypothetical protein V4689_12675 [Verrucomicrobiota bacterium]